MGFLVMIIKNLKKYFTFEVMVLDDKNVRRRFRASNYQSTTRVKPFICTMPMRLDDGWNQIQFTCLTSHAGLMEQTTLKPLEYRFMPTAGFAVSTSLTDSTRKMNCQQNSSSTSQCNRRNNENLI